MEGKAMNEPNQQPSQTTGKRIGCLLFLGVWFVPIAFVWIVHRQTSSPVFKTMAWVWTVVWSSILVLFNALPSSEELDMQYMHEAKQIVWLPNAKRELELSTASEAVLDKIEKLNPKVAQTERSRREKLRKEEKSEELRQIEIERSRTAKNKEQELQARLEEKFAEATCTGDIQCAASKHWVEAATTCQIELEKMAKFDFRWTTGFGEAKLSGNKWSTRPSNLDKYGPKRIIEYRGNDLQLQNGFGAYRRVRYECDFDPIEERLVAIRID